MDSMHCGAVSGVYAMLIFGGHILVEDFMEGGIRDLREEGPKAFIN
jgi:hypothetical protein